MGPLFSFYLKALQIICTHCSGAYVYPVQPSDAEPGGYAGIAAKNAGYTEFFYFYCDGVVNANPRLVHHNGYIAMAVFENLGDFQNRLATVYALSDEPIEVSPAFSVVSKVLAEVASCAQPTDFELSDFAGALFESYFDGVPGTTSKLSEVLSDVTKAKTFLVLAYRLRVIDHYDNDCILPGYFYFSLEGNTPNEFSQCVVWYEFTTGVIPNRNRFYMPFNTGDLISFVEDYRSLLNGAMGESDLFIPI